MSAPGTELCANPSEWPNSCAATAKRLVPESEGNVSNFLVDHIYFPSRIFLQVFFFVFWKKKIKFLLSKLEQTTTFWRGNKIPGKKKIIWVLFWKDIPSWWFISHLKWNSYRLLTCNTAIFSYFYYKLCTKFSKFIYNLRV